MPTLYERVTEAALPDWTQFQIDQHKITYQDMLDLQEGLRLAINRNFTDLKKLVNGSFVIKNATQLMGATLSNFATETLQDNDTTVPTSKQVLQYILTYGTQTRFYGTGTPTAMNEYDAWIEPIE